MLLKIIIFLQLVQKHTDKFYYVDGKSTVDVDKVDYKKYKKLLQVPWYYAKMEAGDCLYLPYL